MAEVATDVHPTDVPSPSAATTATAAGSSETTPNKSALQENIDRRGTNAYYYAHSHKATGPAWDGKAEPKLLATHQVQQGHRMVLSKSGTFDYSASNITTYAFLDDGPKVKLYIDLDGVGERCSDDDVTLDYTETSLRLKVANYQSPTTPSTSDVSQPAPRCLCFARLSGPIASASFKLKANRIILTLVKANADETWHTINDKGSPDHEVV
jgi:hypothetical protein